MFNKRNLLALIGITLLSFLTMGYHPGLEDDHVYLAAIQKNLHPALYPFDARFFQVQLQATAFDKLVAGFVRFTSIPVAYTALLWQVATIFLILAACARIARFLFGDERAVWGGVLLTGAMLTLPVSGTALTLVDQHLHPRGIATACILLAVSLLQVDKHWIAGGLLTAAFLLHPIMAAFGLSFCIFLLLANITGTPEKHPALAAFAPLGWIFEPPNAGWNQATATRRYYFLARWTWYEWLGAIGPLLLFWVLDRWSSRSGSIRLQRFARVVLAFSGFQLLVAVTIQVVPACARMIPLQPMRYLHLVYFFMVLLAGSLMGRYLLKSHPLRWVCFALIAFGAMFAGQRSLYAASAHLELPWTKPVNSWVEAFAWIRDHTPQNAYFALDPEYMAAAGEDFHSFRALAERSVLADALKDAAVVTQVPDLGTLWIRQVQAQAGWRSFGQKDFERLESQFGVTWILVDYPRETGLRCIWHNRSLQVCRIP
jgi:hypothetical protein